LGEFSSLVDALGISWTSILTWASTALAAYFVGTMPTAYLAGRLFSGQDIRQMGDGNAGAANVAYSLGVKVGIGVGIVDIAKGAAAVLLARFLFDSPIADMIAGVLVIAGHNWPVYLQGRGGRGAATAVGVLMAVVPVVGIPIAVPALTVLYLTRSTTRALATYYIPIPFLALWPAGYSVSLVGYSLAIPILVGFSHYLSLRRRPATSREEAIEGAMPPG
jgi:glycerol-3-phosphate acyltransferase PlsY